MTCVTRKANSLAAAVLAVAAMSSVRVAAEPFALGRAGSRIDDTTIADVDRSEEGESRIAVPEFPPSLFTDGGRYRLNDLDGKVVILLFYDGSDPRFAATAANRAAVVRLFTGRPVAFFGVQAATVNRAREDARRLGLPMPVFADNLGILALRYRVVLTPAKSWHAVIIGPAGEVRHDEMLPTVIEEALETARWTYRGHLTPVDSKVAPAIDLLESGNYDAAARHIRAVANGMDRKAAGEARQLLTELRGALRAWKDVADRQAAASPIAAYDLYARCALFVTAPDAAKLLADAMKRLEADPAVKSELAARALLEQFAAAVSHDEQVQKQDAVAYCEQIIKAHPATAVAQSLVAYLNDLGGAKSRGVPRAPVRRKPD